MQKAIIFFFCLIFYRPLFAQQISVANLQCEYEPKPLGVEAEHPQFSWQLFSAKRNVLQSAYRILVADDSMLLQKNIGNVWDTKKVISNQSIQVNYNGKKLLATHTYFWKAMVWDNLKDTSVWCTAASWQMGLLTKQDWKNAQWIAYKKLADSLRIVPGIHGDGDAALGAGKDILPLFRKEFTLTKQLKKATAFVAGLGHFDLRLNGKKVGDHFLDAGWTQYDKHALYVTFDITSQVVPGANALGIMLGNGFYYTPRERYRKITVAYGYPKMICLVRLEYEDGSSENIISDTSWKTTPGPITFSSIYGGEDHDANLEQPKWDLPLFNDSAWNIPLIVDGVETLNAQTAPPLKIFDTFSIKKITHPKPGIHVYDFGQNASGIFSISVSGKKGSRIKLSPAELITDDGLVTQDAVGAPVYFNYILKGDSVETWQPQFTYYGFRYIQVEDDTMVAKNELPVIVNLQSLHTRNSAATTGSFSCSNDLFNRTFTLINWAIKSNMASVFTDCPHREKLGWLEEAHLVGPSIRYNYGIASLCKKIVRDMINAQTRDGLVPDIAPEYVHFDEGFRDSPEWGSNCVILPWYVYQWYGDKQVLEEAYPMMQRYIGYLQKKSVNNILAYGLGDWFDIGAATPGESQLTPKGVTATAIYYYDLDIINKVAKLLGKNNDSKAYGILANNVKLAFNKTYFNKATKQYASGSQAANAMAVYMGLVNPAYNNAVVNNIIKDIQGRKNSLTAGDIGYRYLLRVLDDNNRSDIIFNMNSQSDVPGYGYQLAHGATALTESWQAYRFVSNNHFMLGHLMEWFYSGLGGIRPAKNAIAFKQITIRPEPVGNLTSANVKYNSPYGIILSQWKKGENSFELTTNIPVNTTATIYLPAKNGAEIFEDNKPLSKVKGLYFLGYKNGVAMIAAGSGHYEFKVTK